MRASFPALLAFTALATLSASLAGCTRDDPPAPKTTTPSAKSPASATPPPKASGSAATPGPEKKAAPKPQDIPPEKRKEYAAKMKDGRKLAAEKKWGEASAIFQKALDAIPDDGRALADGSWAAFQAGDLPRAERLAKQGAKKGHDTESRARCLYNLGRVEEQSGRGEKAAEHYGASLALRPNDVVKKQLEALPKKGAPAASASAPPASAAPLPCVAMVQQSDVFPCLERAMKQRGEDEDTGGRTVAWLDGIGPLAKHEKKLKIATAPFGMFETSHFLVASQLRGWQVVAELPTTHNPGAFGIHESLSVEKADVREIGGNKVLWLEVLHGHTDSDMGIDEITEDERREVVLCVLSDEKHMETKCPVSAPLLSLHTRSRMNLEELDEETKKLATPGLPIREETTFDVTIANDGQVTVKLKKGAASAEDKPRLGVFKLW